MSLAASGHHGGARETKPPEDNGEPRISKRVCHDILFHLQSVQSIYNSVIKFKPHQNKLVTMNINYIPYLKLNTKVAKIIIQILLTY